MKCAYCGQEVYNAFRIVGRYACAPCYENEFLKNDPRILKLKNTDTCPNLMTNSNDNQMNEFDELTQEALSFALAKQSENQIKRNYELLDLTPSASLDEVRERCKELVSIWHPDLYKDDPEKHKLGTQKVQEFKYAYEAIKKEAEKSSETLIKMFEILELNYGASFEEVQQSFEKLQKIYNPDRYTEDPELFRRVKNKLKEITTAFEYIKSNQYKRSNQINRTNQTTPPTQDDRISTQQDQSTKQTVLATSASTQYSGITSTSADTVESQKSRRLNNVTENSIISIKPLEFFFTALLGYVGSLPGKRLGAIGIGLTVFFGIWLGRRLGRFVGKTLNDSRLQRTNKILSAWTVCLASFVILVAFLVVINGPQ